MSKEGGTENAGHLEILFESWNVPQRTPVGGEMAGSLGGGISLKE